MAIAEDASAPASVHTASGSGVTFITTASFTPVAGSLLVAVAESGSNTGGLVTCPVTDSLGSTWTLLKRANAPAGNGGSAEVWAMDAGASPAARTVTATGTGGTFATGVSLTVKVLTGALPAASCLGASATALGTTAYSIAITPLTLGSLLAGGLVDVVTATGALTANGVTTVWQSFLDAGSTEKYAEFRATALTTVTGSPVTIGFSTTAGDSQNLVAVEILPAAATAAGGGASQAQPGRTWLRRFHHRQQLPPPAAVITAAAPAGTAVFRAPLARPGPHRASLGARGALAAGILATGIGPPAVPPPHQPPVIVHPAPHRAQWRAGAGSPPNAAQQVKAPVPVTVHRRVPHAAAWRAVRGAAPGALPQPFRPVTVYRRAPHGALWRGGAGTAAGTVLGSGLPQPFKPPTVYSRKPHAAAWRSGQGAPPAARPQPFRPVTVYARAAHRALWRVITGPPPAVAVSTGAPQPFKPVTVYARRPHGAIWRAVTGRPPAAAAQPFKPGTVYRRTVHGAAWRVITGRPPAAVRQPRTPATVFARVAHRVMWRSGLGSPAAPPPPFTVGALSAADKPGSTLTGGTASSALTASTAPSGALTARDQRTGGPGG